MNLKNRVVVSSTNIANKEGCYAYENSFKEICKIDTLEQAVYIAKRIICFENSAKDLIENGYDTYSLNVFKEGIRPEWEDKENINGCSFIVTLKHGKASNYIFENLFFAFIQDRFTQILVNGIRVDVKQTFVKISIWVKNIPVATNNGLVFKELSTLMGFDSNVSFMIKKHQKMVEQLSNLTVSN